MDGIKRPILEAYWPLLGLFCFIVLGSSCASLSPAVRSIPPDATFAARTNILRATYQVPNWKDILREEFSVDVESDTSPRANFLGSSKAYIYGKLFHEESNYVAFAIRARNTHNLEKFVRNMNPDLEVRHMRRFKYVIKNKSLLGWSHKLLILLDARQAPIEDSIVALFDKIAHLKPEEGLYQNSKNFQLALRNDNDVALWINSASLGSTPLLQKFAQNVDLDDNFVHVLANFDEGRIAANTKYYTNEAFFAAYQKLLSRSVKPGLLKPVPLSNPSVVVATSVDPDAIPTFLKDIEWTDKVKNLVQSMTLSIEDFFSMISGDFVVALQDVKHLEQDLSRQDSLTPLPKKKSLTDMVVGLGLRDPVIFDTLINTLEGTGLLEREENYYRFFREIFIIQKDSLVYFTKNEQIKDDFLQGKELQRPEMFEMINTSENWMVVYADEGITERTVKGKSLLKTIARNLLKNENIELEHATINLATVNEKMRGGETVIFLKDKYANSLLAVLEVLKEIVLQTKIRLDPNFWEEGE